MTPSTRWGVAASLAATLLLAGCGGAGQNPVQDGQSLTRDIATRPGLDLTVAPPTENAMGSRQKIPVLRQSEVPLTADTLPEPSGLLATQSEGNVVGTMGTFRLVIEADLTAHIEMPRQAQTQGDKYLLGIDQFFKPQDIRVQRVERTGTNSLTATVAFSHPFKRPADLLPPATATKRLDLHVFNVWAGLLINGSESYFGGTVTTNTGVLRNADSYRQTGGMITLPSGINANVFPGKWVADQSPANTDPALDNYNPASNGWTGSNLQDPKGFGVFPQGATVEVPFEFNLAGGGPFTLDFAVLADYQDPRATPVPRNNRLPDPLDQTKLRYILPYGAGDLQKVNASVAGNLTGPSLQTVTVSIVDLDADAGTTGTFPDNSNLSLMPFPSGISSVDTSFPTGITASAAAEASGSGSGIPTSPKLYEFTISNTGALADGDYTGMVRVVDAENDNVANEFYVQLDPNLSPLPTLLPIQVYQAVPFTVGTPSGGAVEIIFHGGATDPSYAITDGWAGPLGTQHPFNNDRVTSTAVDQRTGQPFFGAHGPWAWIFTAFPTDWKNGVLIPYDDGVNINIGARMFRNLEAGTNTQARPDRNRAYIVGDGYLDQAAVPLGTSWWSQYAALPANPNGATPRSGIYGSTDLISSHWSAGFAAFDGRPCVITFFDAFTWMTNFSLGAATYGAIGNILLFGDQYYAGPPAPAPPNPSVPPTPSVHQGFVMDLALFRGDKGFAPRESNTNDLAIFTATHGTYVASRDALPANTQYWQLFSMLDYDNPGTGYVEMWGEFVSSQILSSQASHPGTFGTGAGQINPNTVVGMDFSRSQIRLFVLDSVKGIEAYEAPLVEVSHPTWTFTGLTSPPGYLANPVDIAVTQNNYVVVLDKGGPGGTDRLVALDHDTLEVLGTRDIGNTVDGEITAGAVGIAADDSLLNIPDTSTFVLLWDDPTGLTSFGPVGGLYWYTIEEVP